mmetsp:Transcript_39227/g.122738  ORF Transcript_39227/g.122738 Transcript_39227/m.122738 type:complete len:1048 (-) Transcript_39227:67-3210(-)|eukprot:CAMPEP_0118871470 /NCGR_PEP_ID=MMETSP1163-20130328/14039_1 /TAXON_ID=124430 /ORGANISM="Phaeomonas parva, Strain CCMP2877" /LENGTH=1047 /DNA_ID=CAMNT_0006806569 /DNA_START=76 /DNA_END=3219 /DNA_ORIENTATION=+
MAGGHLSKDFYDLVKAIGESKSKQEEDNIIQHEVKVLKARISDPNNVRKKLKEFIVRLLYVEMLGHDASFGYIKAVELTASPNVIHKKVGYLACSLCLSPTHEFRFMLINQLQRDLHSTNFLEVCAALSACSRLATKDMIPAVLQDVIRLLGNEHDLVRKKSVMCVHQFFVIDPESVVHLTDHLRRALCDRDPSVMGAALCALHEFVKINPVPFKDLVPSFVSILKQVTEHRLPRDFDYHRIPAPWIQMRLLKILGLLGQADQGCSEGMYETLIEVIRRADTGINVGYAIIYECIKCITTIYPNTVLLDAAAASISRFISANNHNLKYLGVTGLALIVKDHPRYAEKHQLAVIDCLEDPDETLRRKTLNLLYRMVNPVNVEFITQKLLDFLKGTADVYLKTELVTKITACAEKYAPSNTWYVNTITNVFVHAGDICQAEVAHSVMTLVAEGSGEDEESDEILKFDTVERYAELLFREEAAYMPKTLVNLIAWVLGEYGNMVESFDINLLMDRLSDVARAPEVDIESKGFIVTALMKLTVQAGSCPGSVHDVIETYSGSKDADLQQRCLEFLSLIANPNVMVAVLPYDGSCEEIEVDENLGFLNNFVNNALKSGAPVYSPPEDDDDLVGMSEAADKGPGLNFTPYAKPEVYQPKVDLDLANLGNNKGDAAANMGAPAQMAAAPAAEKAGLNMRNVQRRWGKPTPQQAAAAAPAPVTGSGAYPPPTQAAQQASSPAPAPSAAAPVMEEPAEKEPTERELMAAALFGGMQTKPSAAAKPRVPQKSRRKLSNATSPAPASSAPASPALTPQTEAPAPAPAAAPAPEPEPEMDLLGLQAPAEISPAPVAAAPSAFDAAPVDLLADLSMGPANDAPVDLIQPMAPAPAPAAEAPAPAEAPKQELDVFSAMADLIDTPAPTSAMPGLGGAPGMGGGPLGAFQYNGQYMAELNLSTQEYGSKWGHLRATAKVSVKPCAIRSVDALAQVLASAGVKIVETVPNTLEVIAAGTVASNTVLLHGMAQPGRNSCTVTAKSVDNTLSDALAKHLERVMKG